MVLTAGSGHERVPFDFIEAIDDVLVGSSHLVSLLRFGRWGAGPDLREAALIWCQTRALVAHAMAEDARLAAEVAEAQLGTGLTVLRFSSEAMRHQAFRPRAVRW